MRFFASCWIIFAVIGAAADTRAESDAALTRACADNPTYECAMSEALAAARGIDDEFLRALAFRGVAEAEAEADDLTAALSAVGEIDDLSLRFWVLRDLAAAKAEKSRRLGATLSQDDAEKIDDPFNRAEALRESAAALAKENGAAAKRALDGALSAARSVRDSFARAQALREVGLAMAEFGDSRSSRAALDESLSAARIVGDWFSRAWALCDTAVALAMVGAERKSLSAFDSALLAARKVPDETDRASALRDFAGAKARAGMFRDAMEIALMIEQEVNRSRALSLIAKHLKLRKIEQYTDSGAE